MLLPLVSILIVASPGHGATQAPNPQPKVLNHSTLVPVPELEDTTLGNEDNALDDRVGNDYGDYIVGGNEVSPKYSLGYQALVKPCHIAKNKCSVCGGTVVHPRYVITAAHCLFDEDKSRRKRVTVMVGKHNRCDGTGPDSGEGGQEFVVSEDFVHEDYKHDRTFDNDIAILKLPRDIIFNARVWPACLPDSATTDYTGKRVTASGWGTTTGYDAGQRQPHEGAQCRLREINLKVTAHSDSHCSWALRSGRPDTTRLCAYSRGKDSCQGDSGGPLTVRPGKRYVLLGVTSYGRGCADSRYAGIYARVQGFLPWIKEKVPASVGDAWKCGTAPAPAVNILTGDFGMLYSPGYPGNYPDNQDKTFPIVTAEGRVIQVTFQKVDIENHNTCQYDSVMAKDGDGTVLMARTCGSKKAPPTAFTSHTNKVQIIFHSDNNINGKGFQLSWKAVDQIAPTTTHPKTVRSTTAAPTTAPPTTAPPTTAFPTTAPPTSGAPATAPPKTAPPATAAPTTAVPTTAPPTTAPSSSGAAATAPPTTAQSTTAPPATAAPMTSAPTRATPTKGVQTTIAQTTVPSKQEGILASQNFPSNYPNNVEKIEPISVPQGSVIMIKFISFDLQNALIDGRGGRKCGDYLSVKDKDGTVLMKRSCGSILPKSFTSKTNEVIVTFVTDYWSQKPGFQLSWVEGSFSIM